MRRPRRRRAVTNGPRSYLALRYGRRCWSTSVGSDPVDLGIKALIVELSVAVGAGHARANGRRRLQGGRTLLVVHR